MFFFHFKMLSNIVNIKWQTLKTFRRGKLELLRTNDEKRHNYGLFNDAMLQKIKLDKGAFLYG